MAAPGVPPLAQRARAWFRIWRFPVSAFILAAGILLSLLAFAAFTPLGSVWPFSAIVSVTGTGFGGENWNLWFAVLGPILVLIGGYLVGVYLVARSRFEELMRSKSKAELLRNIPEIEQLLWDLTPAHEQRYLAKCAELRIRR
ncbi:MAG: hypothetical protein QXG65_02570 [Thermoplasmata archaeon]